MRKPEAPTYFIIIKISVKSQIGTWKYEISGFEVKVTYKRPGAGVKKGAVRKGRCDKGNVRENGRIWGKKEKTKVEWSGRKKY